MHHETPGYDRQNAHHSGNDEEGHDVRALGCIGARLARVAIALEVELVLAQLAKRPEGPRAARRSARRRPAEAVLG